MSEAIIWRSHFVEIFITVKIFFGMQISHYKGKRLYLNTPKDFYGKLQLKLYYLNLIYTKYVNKYEKKKYIDDVGISFYHGASFNVGSYFNRMVDMYSRGCSCA